MQERVFVIVVGYRSEKWLCNCFTALRGTTVPIEIIFVDDASNDQSIALVSTRFPEVCVIRNAVNIGFAASNNIAIRRALALGADYVVLLNPDTKVEPSWLLEILKVSRTQETIGILGALQLEYDSVKPNSYTRRHDSVLLGEIGASVIPHEFILKDWVEGSCFVVRRNIFASVGLLDEIYGSFFEEVDLCRRARYAGFRTALVPQSRYHHYRGASWKASPAMRRLRSSSYHRSHLIYRMTDAEWPFALNIPYGMLIGARAVMHRLARCDVSGALGLLGVQTKLLKILRILKEKRESDLKAAQSGLLVRG